MVLVVAAAAFLCSGCDRIPGTEGFAEEKAKRVVREQWLDPTTAEFSKVETRSGTVCGEVNGKNKLGAYVGFSRFVIDLATYKPLIDPQFDLSDLLSARDLCAEMTRNEYSSASSTFSACRRVSELELQEARQQSFDEAWAQHCEGSPTRPVYRPPLPSSQSENINETLSVPDVPTPTSNLGAESKPQSANEPEDAGSAGQPADNSVDGSIGSPDANNVVSHPSER